MGLWHVEDPLEIPVFRALTVPTVLIICTVLHNTCPTAWDILEPAGNISLVPASPMSRERIGHGQQDQLAGLLSALCVHPVEL